MPPLLDAFFVHDLLIALSLVLVIEGIWPFLSPQGYRRILAAVALEKPGVLRIGGLFSMLAGLVLLYLVN